MIAILDYGLGNIKAFANIFKNLNIEHTIIQKAEQLESVDKIILPGVGAFDYAMQQFNQSGLRTAVEDKVLNQKIPILGICVGMQMLANGSDEGQEKGLSWIDGEVKLFSTENIKHKTKLPHMGWNEINHNQNPLFQQIDSTARFYFVHSYYFKCNNEKDTMATTEYGFNFSSAVNHNNIYGVQFHPEKSHSNGIQLLKNFATL